MSEVRMNGRRSIDPRTRVISLSDLGDPRLTDLKKQMMSLLRLTALHRRLTCTVYSLVVYLVWMDLMNIVQWAICWRKIGSSYEFASQM